MKILITGVAGFIGFNLAHKMLESELSIVGLDVINGGFWSITSKFNKNARTKPLWNLKIFYKIFYTIVP